MTKTTTRTAQLRQMLGDLRQELQEDVRNRLRDGRTGASTDVRDPGEDSDNLHQRDIGFTVLQMRADMLVRVDEALRRLDAGRYGNCVACDGEIAKTRLAALPFAVRCRACEGRREQAKGRAPQSAGQSGNSLFSA